MFIKFCGMTRQTDLDAALHLGADWCGFLFHPESPRFLAPEAAARLDSGRLKRVGVFVRQKVPEILATVQTARLDLVQLHGGHSLEEAAALAQSLGPERILRVLWPGRLHSLAELQAEMQRHAGQCGYFLLDAGSSGGGSGQTLDWQALAGLQAPRPWLLAGGLDADKLATALALCQPDGLDLNSGVEDAPGQKNHEKMAAAVTVLRRLCHE